MTPAQAFDVASQWGSYISTGDPGACFYSFHFSDGRPQNETHRAACLEWIDAHCLPGTRGKDRKELIELRAFLSRCDLRLSDARSHPT